MMVSHAATPIEKGRKDRRSRINAASISVIFDDSAVCRSSLASPRLTTLSSAKGTRAGDDARLMMLVLHDDVQREYAYGPARGLPDTHVGTFRRFDG
jgi:hypothetical protein